MRLAVLIACCLMLSGCMLRGSSRAAATPFTLARDIVDVPLMTVTNLCLDSAREFKPARSVTSSFNVSLQSGIGLGPVQHVMYWLLKGGAGIVGTVDYIACRSVWPQFPKGISPWRDHKKKTWGDMFFPSSRTLWGDPAPVEGSREEDVPRGRVKPPVFL